MIKTKKNKKSKKKGFTLVELLAVIIILAIVVGITIPAVLTTTAKTKEKALKTAAESVANWVDRQYEVYRKGLDDYGLATLDSNWSAVCLKTDIPYTYSGATYYLAVPTCARPPSTSATYLGQQYTIRITPEFITAAGLQANNVRTVTSATSTWSSDTNRAFVTPSETRIWINPVSGRSCVTLVAAGDGDYGNGNANIMPIACGGVCQSTNSKAPDYCKKGTVTYNGSTYSFSAG